tara:strand:+ start:182 stop:412 length:231 start_codon:yes stop_codon:yes gene_type:complete
MNYDDWKLATPDYEEMVSDCCGQDWEETENEVDGEIGIVCIACGDWCDTIEEREYNELQKQERAEMRMDEERLERD